MAQSQQLQPLPLNIVGSTKFGRYAKISDEQTFNMIISDEWLVPYAGHKLKAVVDTQGIGRGIHACSPAKFDRMIIVVDDGIYLCDKNIIVQRLGTLRTAGSDVSIAENNANQVAICDGVDIWIYNYATGVLGTASVDGAGVTPLDFVPTHVSFLNGQFIAGCYGQAKWKLSDFNNGLKWPAAPANIGGFQTKSDYVKAVVPMPSAGNQVLVFGSSVTENWTDVGGFLFPYSKNTSTNIDYGCVNQASIALGETIVVWVGGNEKSGYAILYTKGGSVEQISTDGINYLFAQLHDPTNCAGFLSKQDGHLIYQVSFYDPQDNITIAYDFMTNKLFSLCDENQNYHIAKKAVFYNNSFYFISHRDGNLYELNSKYTTFDGAIIPRIRICQPIRRPDNSPFMINTVTVPIEQGENENVSMVGLSISKDGAAHYSPYDNKILNSLGKRPNMLRWWGLGRANEVSLQFRFWGDGRFVASNGTVDVYQ